MNAINRIPNILGNQYSVFFIFRKNWHVPIFKRCGYQTVIMTLIASYANRNPGSVGSVGSGLDFIVYLVSVSSSPLFFNKLNNSSMSPELIRCQIFSYITIIVSHLLYSDYQIINLGILCLFSKAIDSSSFIMLE